MTQKGKAEFRRRWAATTYERLCKEREKSVAYKKVDSSKGRYMPFACVVREEGGDAAALTAATNYASACKRMGGTWLRYNRLTRREEYLYMTSEVAEVFEQSWREYEISHSVMEGGEPPARSRHAKREGEGALPTQQKAQVENPTTTDKTDKHDTPRKRTDLDDALARAYKHLKSYQTTLSQAQLLQDTIQSDNEWSWALNSKPSAAFQKNIEEIDILSKTPFARNFLTMDAKSIKTMYKREALLSEALNFSQAMQEPLADLAKMHRKLLCMHREHSRE